MGVAQNALHGLVGTVGVGATMLSRTKFKQSDEQSMPDLNSGVVRGMIPISESNDGQKAQMMAKKARENLMQLRKAKINVRKIRHDSALTDRQKSIRINKELESIGGSK